MSNALLLVKYPDGRIMYGQYHGTSDICHNALFSTQEEAWAPNRKTDSGWRALEKSCECKDGEWCEVVSTYGFGHAWLGNVCTKHNCILHHGAPYDEDIQTLKLPQWYKDIMERKCQV